MLDYLDTVSERPVDDPLANGLNLHRSFEAAVDVDVPIADDYYALQPHRDDGGYLAGLTAACREALGGLPSYTLVRDALRRRAVFAGEAQSRYHAIPFGLDDEIVAGWAGKTATALGLERETEWWEMVAAGSSSVPVGALMAAAADPATTPEEIASIESTYFPWAASLTSLLDCLIDLGADEAIANNLNRYSSQARADERLVAIASRSLREAAVLRNAELHELMVAAMGGYYLAQPNSWRPGWEETARRILEALGGFGRPTLAVHCLRQGRPRAALSVARGGTAAQPRSASSRSKIAGT